MHWAASCSCTSRGMPATCYSSLCALPMPSWLCLHIPNPSTSIKSKSHIARVTSQAVQPRPIPSLLESPRPHTSWQPLVPEIRPATCRSVCIRHADDGRHLQKYRWHRGCVHTDEVDAGPLALLPCRSTCNLPAPQIEGNWGTDRGLGLQEGGDAIADLCGTFGLRLMHPTANRIALVLCC